MPEISAYAKGVMGEAAACDYLEKQGLSPICRRYRSPYGEIDLIMLDGETLVFVEVKVRGTSTVTDAIYAVTPKKQHRLIQTARCFLGDHPEHVARMLRFDVLAIGMDGIRHIPNAFEGAEW